MSKYNLFEVRVAGFIFNAKQELLLLKNKKGTWGILGGHLEQNEEIEDTMKREALEEAQIKLDKVIFNGMRNINHSFIVGFACTTKSTKVILQEEEVSEYKWIKLEDLEKLNLTFKELPDEAKKAYKIIFKN